MSPSTAPRHRVLRAAVVVLATALAGCASQEAARSPSPDPREGAPSALPATPAEEAQDEPVVVVLGDSLAAGSGLAESEAFPALVEERLRAAGRPARVVNAGVSGGTTAGGLRAIDWVLGAHDPAVVLIALGANDGLRGLPVEEVEANLRELVQRSRDAGARVLLAGMLIPPNYGPERSTAFAAVFPRVAQDLDVPLIPFLLEGVAAEPELNLPDGIHPNARGQEIVAETVVRHLLPLIPEPNPGEGGSRGPATP